MKPSPENSGFCALLIVALAALAGCNPQAAGFALPPGDPQAGRATFQTLECNHCHFVRGDLEQLEPGHDKISFPLGGTVSRVKTYGDLVTSIINPSHRISGIASLVTTRPPGESTMRMYNEVMTVQQLIDLTSYLQSTYRVVPPRYTPYLYP